ncbi:MAG: nucleoside monophosphate kinase [Candidatus Sulfobium sp.]|jgi:adenylate kinase
MAKSLHERPASFLLIGPTGAGKTPFGDCLEKKGLGGKRCIHFDFGRQLRIVAGSDLPPAGFHREEHSFIMKVLTHGLLLENEHFHIALKILEAFARSRGFRQEDVMVLNGLPRHLGQAEDMDDHVDIRGLIVLDCTPEDVHRRLRRNTGGDRTERDDDGVELVMKKLEIFRGRTEPLIEYYAGAGKSIFRVKVGAFSTAEEVYRDFLLMFGSGDV